MEENFWYNLYENKFTVVMCLLCIVIISLQHQNQTIVVFISIKAYLIKALKTKACLVTLPVF